MQTNYHPQLRGENIKENKMIERIPAHVQGKLGEKSVDDIKNHIVDIIENQYSSIFACREAPENPVDASHYAASLMFGPEHFVGVNSKNIEFSDCFYYQKFRPQSDTMIRMISQGWIKVFLVCVWVYRLGQYSYFVAEVTPLLPDNTLTCTCEG